MILEKPVYRLLTQVLYHSAFLKWTNLRLRIGGGLFGGGGSGGGGNGGGGGSGGSSADVDELKTDISTSVAVDQRAANCLEEAVRSFTAMRIMCRSSHANVTFRRLLPAF
ncbi:hypothetical protein TNCV_4720211 [Trichonephila clavipes]|uniref:Uncharacterized protein n=1 Tax=Trichonephila clavipes TaxID=2585209 RepID=A0A8X7BEW0_TRICX|nr:hypothetical protein TNCV_4720211 [Trichonephila clavipes]